MSRNWVHEVERANYSIQYTDVDSTETSPLLNSQQETRSSVVYRFIWIVFLSILFGVGTGIGFYLLYEEEPHWYDVKPLYFIPRETWGAVQSNGLRPLHFHEFTDVEITQTGSAPCKSALKCVEAVKKIQIDHMTNLNQSDTAYNFIIAGDGRTYEGRGWRTKPGFGAKNDSLFIAFLGNFHSTQPNKNQYQQAKVLIQEAIDQKILDYCFTMSLFNETSQNDAGGMTNVYKKLLKEVNQDRSPLNCSEAQEKFLTKSSQNVHF